MKIIIPSAGPVPDQRTVDYVTNIAKRLGAQLVVLRILSEKETEAEGEQSLRLFVENGKIEKVPINIILTHGDITSVIIETAQENSVDLIVLEAAVTVACKISRAARRGNRVGAIFMLGDSLNVLSPGWFAKAETSLSRAKKALGRGDEISEIMGDVSEGRAQLKTAEEMAQVARTTLPEVIKSREMARAAGATNINDYAGVEDDFLTLTKAIEENNLWLAQRDRDSVSKAFRALELRAIKDQTIGEVRKLLAQAENDGARKYAPHSLSMAQQKLKNTDAFITQNPYEKPRCRRWPMMRCFTPNDWCK